MIFTVDIFQKHRCKVKKRKHTWSKVCFPIEANDAILLTGHQDLIPHFYVCSLWIQIGSQRLLLLGWKHKAKWGSSKRRASSSILQRPCQTWSLVTSFFLFLLFFFLGLPSEAWSQVYARGSGGGGDRRWHLIHSLRNLWNRSENACKRREAQMQLNLNLTPVICQRWNFL